MHLVGPRGMPYPIPSFENESIAQRHTGVGKSGRSRMVGHMAYGMVSKAFGYIFNFGLKEAVLGPIRLSRWKALHIIFKNRNVLLHRTPQERAIKTLRVAPNLSNRYILQVITSFICHHGVSVLIVSRVLYLMVINVELNKVVVILCKRTSRIQNATTYNRTY